MPSENVLVYLILGASGSGRRAVVANLIADGLAAGDRAATLLAEGEAAAPSDGALGDLARWRWTPEHAIEAKLPAGATHVFFVTDGRRNPVDQIEAFRTWLAAVGGALGRILCVVHCQWAAQHAGLLPWYDACVHFADVVLLNRREGVANKWLSDFQAHYRAQFLPCLFEFVKDGHVKTPWVVLEPQARRISQAFDEDAPAAAGVALPDDVVIEDEEEIDDADEASSEDIPPIEEDPYFARRPGGRRVKELPDIAKFLGP